ncbi:MAG: glycosyltransferase family 4 protein [Opitutales bacterium]|nr:glycosyltransferase family 4 protein [Opitutales bacterium]
MSFFWILPGWLFFAALGFGATALTLRAARRAAIIDVPNERSSHSVPTPRGGGLSIVAILSASLSVAFFSVDHTGGSSVLFAWFLAGIFLAAFSLIDDVRPVSALIRLPLQLITAAAVLWTVGGWPVLELPGMPSLAWGAFGWLLLLFWIVGLANVYNFMDGIDGIAGTQAVVAGLGWALAGYWVNDTALMWLGLAISGSAGGFLVLNWAPAKIFMGDVGSAFAGFAFAVFPLLAHHRNPEISLTVWLACAVLFVWPFLFDGAYTLLHRLYRRENILQAHRSHLYQRLVISGLRHPPVTLLYGALALVSWPLAALWLRGTLGIFPFSLILLLCLACGLALIVKFQENRARTKRDQRRK